MHGDTTVIRHLATLLREQSDDQRDDAACLVDRARATPWRGRAAEAMRTGVEQHAGQLRHTAELHDAAAAALLAHAAAVDETRALIAALEAAAHDLVTAARHRIAGVVGLVGAVVDPVDDLLDRFVPPSPGDVAWLDVDLPGLGGLTGLAGLATRLVAA